MPWDHDRAEWELGQGQPQGPQGLVSGVGGPDSGALRSLSSAGPLGGWGGSGAGSQEAGRWPAGLGAGEQRHSWTRAGGAGAGLWDTRGSRAGGWGAASGGWALPRPLDSLRPGHPPPSQHDPVPDASGLLSPLTWIPKDKASRCNAPSSPGGDPKGSLLGARGWTPPPASCSRHPLGVHPPTKGGPG